MRKRTLEMVGLGALLLLVLAGCASTGAAPAGDVAVPAPEPDYSAEVGDNGLPTVRALLARYTDAIGGKEALESHSSWTAKGTFSLAAMGVEGDLTIRAAAPDKMTMVIETAMGNIAQGYDGEVAWSDDPFAGPQVLEGSQRAVTQQLANFYGPLNYDAFWDTQETIGEADFEGESCYKVRLVDAEGEETTQYFSKETSLLVGQEGVQDGPMGRAEVKVVLSDYKDFGGFLTPTRTVIHTQGIEIANTIESVTYDDVEPEAFELPDSIKSLL